MSENREPGMAYDMGKLNKVFAFLSIIFFITVLWVFLDDYIRPWKKVQVEAIQIKRAKLEEKIKGLEKDIDPKQIEELEKAKQAAEEKIASRQTEINQAQAELAEINKQIKNQNIINGDYNSQVAALTFEYEVAHAHGEKKADRLFKDLKKYKALFDESKDKVKLYASQQKDALEKIAKLEKELTAAEDEIKKATGTLELLKVAVKKTDFDPVFFLRNAPFLDFLDPTIKIQQIVLNNITDDRYFQQIPKVDRCTTCHTFIDQPGYEDQPNPYKTHPKMNLMVGASSPHPIKQFGCTTCHGGEGHRVNDFQSIAHTPQNEKQAHEWAKKYNWHEPHKVPQPMFALQDTEASCIKCHKGVEYIPQGTLVNQGIKKVQEYGCYACHKIEGWEHKRKPGPSLEKIASKVSKEFFKNWVWDPRSFNPHSRMPTFFNQDNNKDHRFQVKNIAEVNAIAEFMWEKSKSYTPFAQYKGGNSARGKELIKTVGCLGCHGVQGLEEESKKVAAGAAPFLYGTGTKVNPDWLVSWLKKPSHYQPSTIMPSFRLSDSEANDIASYLMSLKNEAFAKLKFEPLDKGSRDEILLEYLSAFDTHDIARAKLAKMSDRERTMDLGYRSVGKYGCYSCHSIDGFEGRAPIGPELSKEGSKPITQFGFGHENVAHERSAWIKAHLQNPRRWDNGTDKAFGDLLRMPNFYMSEKDASVITTFLLGQVAEYVPLTGIKLLNAHEKIAADGMKVVNKFNCIGCHQIDGAHGDILAIYQDDINEGPPRLVGEGHRVQTDWFYHFLDNVVPIRPWLKVRMPSFNLSNDERNAIVAMFQAKSEQNIFEQLPEEVVWLPGEKEAAKQLWNSLNCTSCHAGGFTKLEPTAPNLHMARRRLRASWIKKWLEEPQKIMPGTSMPSFWPDGVAIEDKILGGDRDKQINALVKYVLEFGDKELPNKR